MYSILKNAARLLFVVLKTARGLCLLLLGGFPSLHLSSNNFSPKRIKIGRQLWYF